MYCMLTTYLPLAFTPHPYQEQMLAVPRYYLIIYGEEQLLLVYGYYISKLVFDKISINDRIIMPWHLKGGILFYQFACGVLFPLYCLPFIYRVLSMHLVLLDSRFMSLDQPCSRLVSSLLECGMSRRYVALWQSHLRHLPSIHARAIQRPFNEGM